MVEQLLLMQVAVLELLVKVLLEAAILQVLTIMLLVEVVVLAVLEVPTPKDKAVLVDLV
jgi:hypothetical protein